MWSAEFDKQFILHCETTKGALKPLPHGYTVCCASRKAMAEAEEQKKQLVFERNSQLREKAEAGRVAANEALQKVQLAKREEKVQILMNREKMLSEARDSVSASIKKETRLKELQELKRRYQNLLDEIQGIQKSMRS